LLSQVRQTGPQHFKLTHDTALQNIQRPVPPRSLFGVILKETKLDKYWHFSLRELPADREGGREERSCPLPAWEGKEIATASPLETNPNHSIKREGTSFGAIRKREKRFFICVLEMEPMLMWLRQVRHIAGCRITKQELPPWAIVMKRF